MKDIKSSTIFAIFAATFAQGCKPADSSSCIKSIAMPNGRTLTASEQELIQTLIDSDIKTLDSHGGFDVSLDKLTNIGEKATRAGFSTEVLKVMPAEQELRVKLTRDLKSPMITEALNAHVRASLKEERLVKLRDPSTVAADVPI